MTFWKPHSGRTISILYKRKEAVPKQNWTASLMYYQTSIYQGLIIRNLQRINLANAVNRCIVFGMKDIVFRHNRFQLFVFFLMRR